MYGRVAGRTPAGTITGGTTTGGITRGTTTPEALVSPTCTGARATGMPRPGMGRRSIRGPDTRSPPEGVRRWPAPNLGPNPIVQHPPYPPGARGVQCRPRLDPWIVQLRGAASAHLRCGNPNPEWERPHGHRAPRLVLPTGSAVVGLPPPVRRDPAHPPPDREPPGPRPPGLRPHGVDRDRPPGRVDPPTGRREAPERIGGQRLEAPPRRELP